MIRSIGLGVIVSGLIVIGSAVGVAAQSGGIGGRPANPDPDNPRSQSIFIYTLNKGEATSDQVRISNNTAKRQTIELLAVDGIITNTGAYTCKQNSEEKTGLGATIALARTEVTLEPNTNEKVDFTVTMPVNADVGEHNACIVFQSRQDEGEVQGNVRIRTRQAIRVVATVPGDLKRSITITDFAVVRKDNKETFNASLQNTGNVSADVDTKVYLKDMFGRALFEDGGQYPVLSDQKLELSFVNTKRPFFGGWYTASMTVSYDKRAGVFGIEDKKNVTTLTADEKVVFVPPTTAGLATLVIVALLLIGGAAVWVMSKKNRRYENQTWRAYVIQSGDTIESIARKHEVDWKKLAVRNDIKAPYSLTPGNTLKVPPAVAKK